MSNRAFPSQGFSREGGAIYDVDDLRGNLVLETPVEHFSKRGSDEESELQICAIFTKNISGIACHKSQFGRDYVTWRMSCPASFEEAMGTEKARHALRASAISDLMPYKGLVAVWRKWPTITRGPNGELSMLMRLHLMSTDTYLNFVG